MALPLIPIILAVTALGSGIAQGISAVKNAQAQAESVNTQYQEQAVERAKNAKKLMQQQKTSFLKSGVYFNTGSPLEVINETYDTMAKDISAMQKDKDTKIKNLEREGKTAFYNSLIEGTMNAGMGYFMGGGSGLNLGKLSASNVGSAVKNSTIGTNVMQWYNSARGWTKGGFNGVPTSNGQGINV